MKKTVLIMVAALICVVANAQTDSVSGVRSEELGVRLAQQLLTQNS